MTTIMSVALALLLVVVPCVGAEPVSPQNATFESPISTLGILRSGKKQVELMVQGGCTSSNILACPNTGTEQARIAAQASPQVFPSGHSTLFKILLGTAVGAGAAATFAHVAGSGDRDVTLGFALLGGALGAVAGYQLSR